jgi:hypothetical protein
MLASKRTGPFDGFEVWHRSRCVFKASALHAADQSRAPVPVALFGLPFRRQGSMTEHADHRSSATLSSPDLAARRGLQALANFSEQTSNDIVPSEDTKLSRRK